jgi:ribonucleoside-diphosphate reductase alpha chain
MSARRRLPNRRRSIVFNFEFESHRYRASASRFADGKLAEIFLDTGKDGTPLQSNAETAAVLASLLLQHDVDVEEILHSVHGPIAVALSLARAPSGSRP